MPDAFKFIIYILENVFSCGFHFIISSWWELTTSSWIFTFQNTLTTMKVCKVCLRIEKYWGYRAPNTQHHPATFILSDDSQFSLLSMHKRCLNFGWKTWTNNKMLHAINFGLFSNNSFDLNKLLFSVLLLTIFWVNIVKCRRRCRLLLFSH